MAYDKDKIFEDVINAIKENSLKHFYHIELFVEPDIKTLYEWGWNDGKSNESNTIKKELSKNKIDSKIRMLNNWEKSKNPILQVAAFKLIATDEERKALSSTYIDHTSEGKELKGLTIKWGENEIEV